MRPLLALFVRALRQTTRAPSTYLLLYQEAAVLIVFVAIITFLVRNTRTLLLRRAAEG